ncbi:thiolase C-terminal domain-containing protein [Pseudomonas sp. TUM22785]|nr:beta-ketoacyl synthase N-terminal-like domain-containing protein [Pseudomonas sp. TUM22785]WCD77987.1 beta-ketoacyl synthase N-terminal-like domain-containing protein [Pseudomonas sp. TUM22785]
MAIRIGNGVTVMNQQVLLAGVGVTPFVPLGQGDARALAVCAVRMAMADASIDFELIDHIVLACAQGGAGNGEQLLAPLGFSGIPLINLSDGCASGHAAFHLARQSLLSGESACALVVGCDAMPVEIGSHAFFGLREPSPDSPCQAVGGGLLQQRIASRQQPLELYAAQTRQLLQDFGLSAECLQQVLNAARQRALLDPSALLAGLPGSGWQQPYLATPACGAAALMMCTPAFARRYGIQADIACLASLRGADFDDDLDPPSVFDALGRSTTHRLVRQIYDQAGLGPEDVDVVELHDQSVGDYLINSAALGFCRDEQLVSFAQDGFGRSPGGAVICPSGGLLGRGHAPGATAIAQLVELSLQLSGRAGARQVTHARTALQHSMALGRAVSLTLLQRTSS